MSLKDQKTLRIVLAETPVQTRFETLQKLLENGYTVTCTTESGSVATESPNVLLIQKDSAPGHIVEQAESARVEREAVKQGEWKPWFPVIDYDRCTNCMQCLSFCLFGVYGVDQDHKIEVQNNDSCKTNCPACSRVCPEAAIMFPKYKTGPINGDIVTTADLQREKMKIDISALLGGDVYAMLRTRSERAQSRFSKERDPDKALKERQRCLVKLAEAGDIPAEVLMALPSPEEIAQRAETAKAKAAAALQNNSK
ncbi:MAG: ferredoxin family protein [Verrucomicrobia bacterium]|nr:ferredoxin family protein [Verrucomicrobiota bacterium]